MKIDIKYIYGAIFGIVIGSLIIALRYENEKLARETMFFLQYGMNPFWSLFFMNVLLFLVVPLLFLIIIKLIRIHKKKLRKYKC